MTGEIPTPKWEKAPEDIRQAWHDNNNAQQRFIAALEQAHASIAEMRQIAADLGIADVKH